MKNINQLCIKSLALPERNMKYEIQRRVPDNFLRIIRRGAELSVQNPVPERNNSTVPFRVNLLLGMNYESFLRLTYI